MRGLGRLDVITEVLDPIQVLPAPAQGALAVECRVDDVDTEHLLQSTMDDEATRVAVAAERANVGRVFLQAGCNAPVGALADVVEDLDADDRVVYRLSLRGVAAANWIPGSRAEGPEVDLIRASATGDLTEVSSSGACIGRRAFFKLGAGVLTGTPDAES